MKFFNWYKKNIFILLSIVILTIGFYSNGYRIFNQREFSNFQKESESYVLGRLIIAEREGVFQRGGLTGSLYALPNYLNEYRQQYEILTGQKNVDTSTFRTYNSMTGGQAIILALLLKNSPFSNSVSLELFWLFMAIISALTFALFLNWVKQVFGLGSALTCLVLILLSSWINFFARNIWWVLWSFYLSFIVFLFWLETIRKNKNIFLITNKRIFTIALVSVFLKCFLTGFEYITTTLAMAIIPFVFYAIQGEWKVHLFIKRIAAFALGALSAILLSFCILSYQLSYVLGSVSKGFEHIIYSFLKRTSGVPTDFPLQKESLEANVFEVLSMYWNGIAFDFSNLFYNIQWKSFWVISFGELIVLFMLFSSLLFNINTRREKKKLNKTLVATTAISMIAPLSWFVIFKGHSYIHTHMNFIVWYMPFALFGFVVVGNVLSQIIKNTHELCIRKKNIGRLIIILCITFVMLCYGAVLINREQLFKESTNSKNLLASTGGFDVYLHNNKLWYVNTKPTKADKETMFFLHAMPQSLKDIPQDRQQFGCEYLDFWYSGRNSISFLPGFKRSKYLIIIKQLPKYNITSINTGQFVNSTRTWETGNIILE